MTVPGESRVILSSRPHEQCGDGSAFFTAGCLGKLAQLPQRGQADPQHTADQDHKTHRP